MQSYFQRGLSRIYNRILYQGTIIHGAGLALARYHSQYLPPRICTHEAITKSITNLKPLIGASPDRRLVTDAQETRSHEQCSGSVPLQSHLADSHNSCPVCKSSNTYSFAQTNHKIRYLSGDRSRSTLTRDFAHCKDCDVCFVRPHCYIPQQEETLRYAEHENDPTDPRYLAFLAKAVDPLLVDLMRRHNVDVPHPSFERSLTSPEDNAAVTRLLSSLTGLDYGCGPGPAVSHILRTRWNAQLTDFDPVFFPSPNLGKMAHSLDYVVCTEVIEHMQDPLAGFTQLLRLLRLPDDTNSGGVLCIMTGILPRTQSEIQAGNSQLTPQDIQAFLNWAYTRDPTHIVFYQPSTIEWLASQVAPVVLADQAAKFMPRVRQDVNCSNVFLIDWILLT